MMRTLLIDGDIVAYQAATIAEKPTDWGDGLHTLHADEGDGIKIMVQTIGRFMETLGADDYKVALSDPTQNFRKRVLPSYKASRGATRKPIILAAMKAHLTAEYGAVVVPWLEGDDVLGIWATTPHKGERVIVSIDKDMKTIPGLYWSPKVKGDPKSITVAEADRWHLLQSLTGDVTDGYGGCPDIGPKKAEEILNDPTALAKVVGENKAGEVTTKWVKAGPCTPWQAILDQYAKAGFGPDYALAQARVARILRSTDYDSKRKKVILWNPTVTP